VAVLAVADELLVEEEYLSRDLGMRVEDQADVGQRLHKRLGGTPVPQALVVARAEGARVRAAAARFELHDAAPLEGGGEEVELGRHQRVALPRGLRRPA